jgi:hypothetical protein
MTDEDIHSLTDIPDEENVDNRGRASAPPELHTTRDRRLSINNLVNRVGVGITATTPAPTRSPADDLGTDSLTNGVQPKQSFSTGVQHRWGMFTVSSAYLNRRLFDTDGCNSEALQT